MKSKTYDIVTQSLSQLVMPNDVFEWDFIGTPFKKVEHENIKTPFVVYMEHREELLINKSAFKVAIKEVENNSSNDLFLLATHKWRCWE